MKTLKLPLTLLTALIVSTTVLSKNPGPGPGPGSGDPFIYTVTCTFSNPLYNWAQTVYDFDTAHQLYLSCLSSGGQGLIVQH